MVARGWSSILFVLTACGLATGGLIHAAAFRAAQRAIAAAKLPVFYANAYEALWLSDSATLMVVAAVFGYAAARPAAATRAVVLLLAFVPAGSAVLIYMFMGNFFAGHLLVGSALAAVAGGLMGERLNRGAADTASAEGFSLRG